MNKIANIPNYTTKTLSQRISIENMKQTLDLFYVVLLAFCFTGAVEGMFSSYPDVRLDNLVPGWKASGRISYAWVSC